MDREPIPPWRENGAVAGTSEPTCLSRSDRPQPQVRVVLERLEDRPLRLGERARLGFGRLRERPAERGDHERVRALVECERVRLARAADDAAGSPREADDVLAIAARRAAGEMRREARGQQQLEPERERVRAAGPRRLGVEQRELVREQVVDARVRVAVVEDPRHGLARARRAVERPGVLPEPRVRRDRLRRRDRQEVAAPLVEHQVQAEERLQPAAEARARLAHALCDRAQSATMRGIQVEDPVRFAVADGPENDRLGLLRSGYRTILSEVMSQVTVYTTEPCGYCRVAKALLNKRGVQFEEINLAKDPEGRAELVRVTGMMTFPQVVIDGETVGGYQELVAFDRAGKLAGLAAAA